MKIRLIEISKNSSGIAAQIRTEITKQISRVDFVDSGPGGADADAIVVIGTDETDEKIHVDFPKTGKVIEGKSPEEILPKIIESFKGGDMV